MLTAAVVLAGCAPDITPISVQECEIREHIASVKYLRSETTKRVERTRRLRREAMQDAMRLDTLAAFFNGTRPVMNGDGRQYYGACRDSLIVTKKLYIP